MTVPAHEWTRRQWLWLMASGAVGGSALLQAQKKRPLGVQLYTVREVLKTQPEETLKAIAAIGYKEIELGRADLDKLVPIAKSVGLTPVSTHVEVSYITGKAGPGGAEEAGEKAEIESKLASTFAAIRKHGLTWAVIPYLQKKERPTDADGWKRFGEQLNRAGAAAKKAGLGFGYHNHGFEFEPVAGGTRALDVLDSSFDHALVKWELDVFWVGITGADPVALLKKLGNRVALVHLKDKDKAAPAETDEGKVAKTTFKEVGSGGLDFPAILKAAEAAGVKHFFVEQDQTPGDPVASLKQSYAYLSSLT